MRDRSLSSISFNCFWKLFHDSAALAVIEFFPYLFALKKSFMRLHWSEEKLNHVLKTDGDKLFKDLLINKIFSKEILSSNFEN